MSRCVQLYREVAVAYDPMTGLAAPGSIDLQLSRSSPHTIARSRTIFSWGARAWLYYETVADTALPRAWRQCYEAEYAALLEHQPLTLGTILDVVRGALDAHDRGPWGETAPGRGRGQMARRTHGAGCSLRELY
jgi:hypothetical protein